VDTDNSIADIQIGEAASRLGYEKEARHTRWREETEKVRASVLRRRLFRVLILPIIDRIEDEDERDAELKRAWRDFCGIPLRLFIYRDEVA
jgi:hypothetical protein